MKIPDHIQLIIQAHYGNRTTPEDSKTFEAWLREDDEHVMAFAEHCMVERHMRCQQEKSDVSAIFEVLREAEENAELVIQHVPERSDRRDTSKPSDHANISISELFSLAGYVAMSGLRTNRTVQAIVSIAAVVLIGVTLFFALSGNNTPNPNPIASSGEPDDIGPAPVNHPVVATLTAERGAVWDRRPGKDLYAGQRFSLTQGFAEITTHRGTIAVLEAPCTVELIDSPNAVRLHAGKLVGICETDASKGFLVRTPHMDVTDLGTRFVVDSRSMDATDVFVYEGEVETAPPVRDAIARHRVTAGQAVRAGVDGQIASLDPADHRLNLRPAMALSGMTGYEAAVAQLHPAAWWRQLEASPQASVLGDVRFSDARPPQLSAVTLDGRGALDAGDIFDFDADQPFTMSCWIRPQITHHAFIAGRLNYTPQRGKHGYDLYLLEGHLYFQLIHNYKVTDKPNSLIRVKSNTPIAQDQWTHVTAVYNGSGRASGMRLYIDGQETPATVRYDSLGNNSPRADTTFRIGMRGYALPLPGGRPSDSSAIDNVAGSPFVGQLGEVLIFDRNLSGPEAELIYNESRESYATDQPQPAGRGT